MKFDFAQIPIQEIPAFKGGTGTALVRKYSDDVGDMVHITLPPGSSIGLHTHRGNCEIMYFLSGQGRCLDDGTEYAIAAGDFHYCPEGHSHSVINTGEEPLILFGVLPKVKKP